ncbi:hypothetical protein EZV62_005895 [Acer yangbiense]|uniref:Citrate transporter-like domain-containing protein n=1 Tax=Acer yangbiense TaxID=1000413 RepID=A0A5C7INZ0_9ROSI|nr:hypothetical protein EZV62_005895 [Acer yangbiense]
MLMVIFQVITTDQAYAAIDLPILGLLFRTMVVSVYLERADMFKYLSKLLSWKSRGPKDLLCRICLISAISSALFTNDTSCVVLTEFVLKIARQHNLPPHPFLLALASSANIGSSATPIGNPQNLVIAVQSKISFRNFDEEDATAEIVVEEDVNSHQFSPATLSHVTSLNPQEWNSKRETVGLQSSPNVNGQKGHVENTLRSRANSVDIEIHRVSSGASDSARISIESKEVLSTDVSFQQREETVPSKGVASVASSRDVLSEQSLEGKEGWKRMFREACLYLVTIGMLVSYSLLIFFCRMFITVDGFNRTGIPSNLWDLMEPYAQIDHIGGIAVLTVVILVLSNFASNVPTVLLLGARVAASAAAISEADEKKAWLILAWVSTVAGNLSLLGSAANLIVCEQARSTPHLGYTLSFWRHLKFGVPSTLIVTAIGLTLIR